MPTIKELQELIEREKQIQAGNYISLKKQNEKQNPRVKFKLGCFYEDQVNENNLECFTVFDQTQSPVYYLDGTAYQKELNKTHEERHP